MKTFETLYKRTGTGAIQEWNIKVEQRASDENGGYSCDKFGNPQAKIIIEFGQLNGKKQIQLEVIKEGVNIGKANQTAPYEQALSEAESRWKKQLDRGYKSLDDLNIQKVGDNEYDFKWTNQMDGFTNSLYEALNESLPKVNTDSLGVPKPMLADKYWKTGTRELTSKGKKVQFPILAQPKFNGNRCLALRVDENTIRYSSREGKILQNFHHITKELLQIMPVGDTWDGELYIHGASLQSLRSGIARFNPDITPRLEYRVYDIAMQGLEQNLRLSLLDEAFANSSTKFVHLTETARLTSTEEVEYQHDNLVSGGYEGLILRPMDAEYNFNGRSTMLKVKHFNDDEFDIIGYKLGSRGVRDLTVTCVTKEGKKFDPTAIGTELEKNQLMEAINLGLIDRDLCGRRLKGTVRYFDLSEDKIPQHCHFIAIRDGKE